MSKDEYGAGAAETIEMAHRARSEQYRRYARKCLEMVDETTDRTVKAILIHMAQVWLRLADEHAATGSVPSNED